MAPSSDRDKALDTALANIDRQFGKGSVMRLGDDVRAPIEVIPTGSIALDIALGIGGLPRGRVVEIYGPESSGKTTVALHAIANAQKAGGIAAFIDAEHALDPDYAQKLGVDTDGLLVSQPDTGEQALEIADMLIRSNALDIIVIDSVAALVPRAEIEGEMGDSHVGLQARLMSQALRKLTGALHNSKTTAIFINQLREKIGIMFGCLSYDTRVTLADGSQEKIGKIVNQRTAGRGAVLRRRPRARSCPSRSCNWFDNGPTERFLQFTVASESGRERASAVRGSPPTTWSRRPAAGVRPASCSPVTASCCRPRRSVSATSSSQVVLGGLIGDGNALSEPARSPRSAPVPDGPRRKAGRLPRLEGCRCSGTSRASRRSNAKGAVFADLTPLPELAELQEVVYLGGGKKHLTWDYLKALDPLALAVWYMDDGCFHSPVQGPAGTNCGRLWSGRDLRRGDEPGFA